MKKALAKDDVHSIQFQEEIETLGNHVDCIEKDGKYFIEPFVKIIYKSNIPSDVYTFDTNESAINFYNELFKKFDLIDLEVDAEY